MAVAESRVLQDFPRYFDDVKRTSLASAIINGEEVHIVKVKLPASDIAPDVAIYGLFKQEDARPEIAERLGEINYWFFNPIGRPAYAKVTDVTIDSPYWRGKGLGTLLYKTSINDLLATEDIEFVSSDFRRTIFAEKRWRALIRDNPTTVFKFSDPIASYETYYEVHGPVRRRPPISVKKYQRIRQCP